MIRTDLLSLDRHSMEAFFTSIGERQFRAQQMLKWVYQRQIMSFDQMTDLSKDLRQRLKQITHFRLPKIVSKQVADDGTCKWLLRLHDGNCIETVYIPEPDRGTLCISTQAGCSLNCSFCATAKQGFSRNLDVGEMMGQLWLANHAVSISHRSKTDTNDIERYQYRPITNVVLMGMGEPLLNFDNVVVAMRLMQDDYSFGLSKRRITLSTAGMVPQIDNLAEKCPVSLAISLHAPNDTLRDQLVPLNRKYPTRVLIDACKRYTQQGRRQRITIEYIMLDHINDSPKQAKQLAQLLFDLPSKVNLIPFNVSAGINYRCSSQRRIDHFRDILLQQNIFTITRKTRGEDIGAACGQLTGRINDKTNRSK